MWLSGWLSPVLLQRWGVDLAARPDVVERIGSIPEYGGLEFGWLFMFEMLLINFVSEDN